MGPNKALTEAILLSNRLKKKTTIFKNVHVDLRGEGLTCH